MKARPVLIVDEDADDKEFLLDAWADLKYENPLIFFSNGEDALHYLKTEKTTPFLILCDVNLPKISGFELKEKLLQESIINYKSIPFVFWSTAATNAQIKKAYDLGGVGFFLKGNNYDELKQSLVDIVNYWIKSKVPE